MISIQIVYVWIQIACYIKSLKYIHINWNNHVVWNKLHVWIYFRQTLRRYFILNSISSTIEKKNQWSNLIRQKINPFDYGKSDCEYFKKLLILKKNFYSLKSFPYRENDKFDFVIIFRHAISQVISQMIHWQFLCRNKHRTSYQF